jgi:hypothetical protein
MLVSSYMVITYHGKGFLKLTQGETVIAINPISKESSAKQTRFGADIALITLNHPDYNGVEAVTYGEREPVTISGPGDYEVQNIFIHGTGVQTTLDKKSYITTLYGVEMDSIKLSIIGPCTEAPEAKDREGLEQADILFVPLSGLGAAAAYKLAVSLEPGVIIPTDYNDVELKAFLKEAGSEKIEHLEKLVVKKKDLAGKEGEVMVLQEA